MADACTNIYEYERILLGQQEKYWATFQHEVGSVANKREFGIIWRYAITKILGWTPQEAVKYLNTDIVKRLKLNTTFYAINFNTKHHFIGDFKMAIQLAFPEEKIYDFKAETIAEYKKVAKKDEWKDDPTPNRYNKKFFLDFEGFERARVILNWLIKKYCSDMSPVELYDMFYDKAKASQFCTLHHLETPAELLYSKDMFEFFHDAYDYSSDYLKNGAIIRAEINSVINSMTA